MRALSLWQPWASLMALGLKRVETRSWPINWRGPLVIAATKTWNLEVLESLDLARKPPICDGDSDWLPILRALDESGVVKTLSELPLGAALCCVNVIDCVRTEVIRPLLSERELALGDYRSGRWAFVTEPFALRRFAAPIPCRGRQGIWHFADVQIIFSRHGLAPA